MQGWKIKNVTFPNCRSSARFSFLRRAFRDPCTSVSAPPSVQQAMLCHCPALHASHLNSRAKIFAVVACRYQTPLRSQRVLVAPNCMHQIHIVDTRHRRFRALAHFPIFAPSLSRHFLGKAGARERPPEARESRSLEKLERGKAPLGRGKSYPWKNWSAGKAP